MSQTSVFKAGKAAGKLLASPFRRCLTESRIDAMQRHHGLLVPMGQELVDLAGKAERICRETRNDVVLGDYFTKNNPWSGRRWRKFNYWNGWYALAHLKKPVKVLEIGTAFGFSTIALARGSASSLKLLVSLDLGNFGRLFSRDNSPAVDNLLFVKKGIELYRKENNLDFEYRQFAVNTQPPPYTDNEGNPVTCPYWKDNSELMSMLAKNSFDIILVDGKHTEDALLNDLQSFSVYANHGGLILCDDIQHPDAARSLHRFVTGNKDIAGYYVWHFLRSDNEYDGTFRRDQGLMLKA
jgi:hypothetical protein